MAVRNCEELGKNLQKIVKRLLSNQNLCKLIYFTDKDPLNNNEDIDIKKIYGDLIRVKPRLDPEEKSNSYIVPLIVNGIKDEDNDEFRDFLIRIYVYVPIEQWIIKDDNLRPFAIIGEIQKSLNKKNIDGIGKLLGGDFNLNLLTDDMSCYTVDFYLKNYD